MQVYDSGLMPCNYAGDAVVTAVAARLRTDATDHPGSRTVAFTGGRGAPLPEIAEGVASELRTNGADVEVTSDPQVVADGPAATTILHVPVDDPGAAFLGSADRTIVVARHGADRVADLRAVVDRVRDHGGDVDGVCVVS